MGVVLSYWIIGYELLIHLSPPDSPVQTHFDVLLNTDILNNYILTAVRCVEGRVALLILRISRLLNAVSEI